MRSMTGYGRGTATWQGRQIAVELSAVNRKQSEVALTLPRLLQELEPRVRDEINAQLSRGRLTVTVALHATGATRPAALNLRAAEAYRQELESLRKKLKLAGEITLDQILRGPGVLEADAETASAEAAWPALQKALRVALARFVQMRKKEGSALAVDLKARVALVVSGLKEISMLAPKVMEHHRGALLDRVAKAGLDLMPSDERLLKELIFFADRSDISEEITRVRSHLAQFSGQVEKDEPVGRTLDFLIQELNREINTIGNKANFLAISQIVVQLKTELEKLREQVQNIE